MANPIFRVSQLKDKQKDLFSRRWRTVKIKQGEVHDLHIPLVAMLRWAIKDDVIWRHVPNGEHRDFRTAQKLKAMGVLAGSADLEFFWTYDGPLPFSDSYSISPICALFMELKLPGKKPTDVQTAFSEKVKNIGAAYVVVSSIDAAVQVLGNCGLIKPGIEICGKRWD